MATTNQLYVRRGGEVIGPLPASVVRKWAERGEIHEDSLVSKDGKRWVRASRVHGLALNQPPPRVEVVASDKGNASDMSDTPDTPPPVALADEGSVKVPRVALANAVLTSRAGHDPESSSQPARSRHSKSTWPLALAAGLFFVVGVVGALYLLESKIPKPTALADTHERQFDSPK